MFACVVERTSHRCTTPDASADATYGAPVMSTISTSGAVCARNVAIIVSESADHTWMDESSPAVKRRPRHSENAAETTPRVCPRRTAHNNASGEIRDIGARVS